MADMPLDLILRMGKASWREAIVNYLREHIVWWVAGRAESCMKHDAQLLCY